MRLVLASDHAGFPLKERLVSWLREETDHNAADLGPTSRDSVDYPDYAAELCGHIRDGKADAGILICNSGIGMSMSANRFSGIRAALCLFPRMAYYARHHNDANVLVLGGGITAPFQAREIAGVFLSEGFDGGRHGQEGEQDRFAFLRKSLTGGESMIHLICGARPNFMKIDPIVRNLPSSIEYMIVHTGQHYDHIMSRSFFQELELPKPDVNLEVGSASVTVQTAMIMQRYEKVFLKNEPSAVVVVGDVTSTLACSLVAVRYGVPVIHVEAGLRSFDRTMPEEINRVLTDQITTLLLITSSEARDNLLAEGRSSSCIKLVGNPMIDTLMRLMGKARDEYSPPFSEPYCLVTLHRPSNVDHPGRLQEILNSLGSLEGYRVLFPAHPRTLKRIRESDISVPSSITVGEPLSYLNFVAAEARASAVVTDSGGVQEETSVLGVPCVTVRTSTERPVTLELGTNVLCPEVSQLEEAVTSQIAVRPEYPPEIPMWDGAAGGRIVSAIEEYIGGSR